MIRPLHTMLALFIAIFCASVAYSCSCDNPSQRKAFRKANAVFIGEVVEHVNSPAKPADVHFIVKFRVEKYWKGGKSSEIIIPTFGFPGLCGGFLFESGKKYLVYAYGKELLAYTACDRTVPLEYAADDIKRLNSFWFRFTARVIPF